MRIALPALLVSLLSLSACGGVTGDETSGPRFVAVGAEGTILEAADGASWKSLNAGTTASLSGITHGAGMFVAVGEGGVILSSPNGLQFTQRYSPTGVDLVHVIHTGERFVAVGGDFDVGAVAVSSKDGITWENLVSPSSHMFHAVAHKDDTLIAAAYARSDLQTPALFTSEPGQPWQESIGPDFRDSVTTQDGVFTVGGQSVNHFVDGIGWTSQTISGLASFHAMTHAAGTFVIAGELGTLASSADGKTFDVHFLSGETGYFRGVTHGGDGTFVAVGSDGLIATSKDGAAWTKITPQTTKTLLGVAFGGEPLP